MKFKHLIIILIILTGCSGSKKMLKLGTELEKANAYEEAAEFYFQALNKKSDNVEAYVALKRVSKRVLNSYLDDFYKVDAMEETKEAVYAFGKASDYRSKLLQYSIDHEIPQHYHQRYEETLTRYKDQLYKAGQSALDQSDFQKAEYSFNELLKFDPSFKDAKRLRDIAYTEPLYQAGNQRLKEKDYRAAYNNYQQALSRISDYKDAKTKQARALELGKQTFVVFNIENSTNKRGINDKVASYISNELTKINDPFFRLVDRSNFERILSEQELAISGAVDESTTAELGNLLGAKTAISGRVFTYEYRKSKLTSEKVPAYESYTWKGKDPETKKEIKETRYRKVNYENHSQSCELRIGFEFKIISLETSEVLFSDLINITAGDDISYSSTNKDVKRLFPSSNSGVATGFLAVNRLRSTFDARNSLKSEGDLSNDLCIQISQRVSNKVSNFIK